MVVSRWHAFRAQVLEYNGSAIRQWGLPQLLTWAHLPGVAAWLAGPGRFAILLVSGLTAAAVAWRRPDALVPAVGLAFVLFLRPEPGLRHAVPGLGARRRVPDRHAGRDRLQPRRERLRRSSSTTTGATPCPWHWHQAWAVPFSPRELALMVVTWVLLAAVAVVGLRYLRGGVAGSTSRPQAGRRWD